MWVERVIVARVFLSLARQTTPMRESPASHTFIEMYYIQLSNTAQLVLLRILYTLAPSIFSTPTAFDSPMFFSDGETVCIYWYIRQSKSCGPYL